MKKSFTLSIIFCVIVISGTAFRLTAQQTPVFSSHLYVPELFNPARMGEGFLGVTYRRQWMDLDSRYAPVSYGVNADLSSALNLEKKRIGLGISVLADKVHLMQRYNPNLAFAYHLVNEAGHRLTAGVQAGIVSQQFDFRDAVLFDPSDRGAFLERQNKIVFDGGPGLFYGFQPSEQHKISLDVTAPQLFTSDLNYEQGAVMDLQPHLTARLSYLYQGAILGIEPIVVFREMLGEKKLKAGNLELALRANFLNNRVWAGGGARMDAQTIHFAFGVKPIEKLQVMAAMELNTFFGNSLEFGALYVFSEGSGPIAKIDLTQELNVVNATLPKAGSHADEARMVVQLVRDKLASVEQDNLTATQKRRKLEEIRGDLQQGLARLDMVKDSKREVDAAKSTADNKVGTNKSFLKNKDYAAIRSGEAKVADLAITTEKALRDVETKLGLAEASLPPEIGESVREGNLAEIRAFFQEQLDGLPNPPRNLSPVMVEKANNNTISISYEFPNQLEQYDVSGRSDLSDVRNLTDHIADAVRELRAQGVALESVRIAAKLRDDERTIQRIKSGAYNGEFGNTHVLNYTFTNTSTKKSAARTKSLKKGESVNLEQLAALKLNGIKMYLIDRNIGNTTYPTFDLSAPNSGQTYSQVYSLQIRIR